MGSKKGVLFYKLIGLASIVGLTATLLYGRFNLTMAQDPNVSPVPEKHTLASSTAAIPKPACNSLISSTATFEHADRVKQGQILRVKVTNRSCDTYGSPSPLGKVVLAGQSVPFFPDEEGYLQALVPTSVFQTPGVQTLSIFDNQNHLVKKATVTVANAWYKTQNIVIKHQTAGLQPLPGEMETIGALKQLVTNHKYWREPFITPTPDCENSPFGVKRLYNGKASGNFHKGIDLRSPSGRAIKATNNGKVIIAKRYRLHGGTVGVDHGQGVSSIYIHMSKILVAEGQEIKKGETVGLVGATGFASGPHLHWGLYINGLAVNPNQWLPSVPKCY